MLRSRTTRLSFDVSRLSFGSRSAKTDAKTVDPIEEAMLVEINLQKEEEIEKKRNKSRLSAADYRRLHGQMPYDEPIHWYHSNVKYLRKLYGQYGASSNIDPRICWMDKEELASKLEYFSLAEDRTIPDMIAEIKETRRREKEIMLQRDEQVAKNVAKIDAWKKELKDRVAKKLAEAEQAKARKEKLIEEVRRHFGFKVDPKDERFKEMLEKKEKEQKKADKLAKKSVKDAKMLELIKQQAVELSDSKDEKKQNKKSVKQEQDDSKDSKASSG